ncbi:MAG: YIP1 family protein [Defluviitaleaceae bacterium]|nr:YIP1 family protein [Defluviitaleaceae bacterium]
MTAIKQRVANIDWVHYFDSLKFCLYTCRRPLDGFWDLIHEKRGSLAAAHTIVVVAVAVEIMRLVLTNFQFINVDMETFSAGMVVMQMVMPIILFSVANWCLTTLFDGKGRVTDIYMGYAYAMAPQVIINAVLIPVSHVITFDEGAIYWMFTSIGWFWFLLLVLCAMKQIHDYSFAKAVLTSVLSLVAIAIMVFIFLMFFAVVSDGVAYFYSIGQEAYLRMRRG